MFGEEALIFNLPNSYSIIAYTPVICHMITYTDLKRDFKRLLSPLADFFIQRHKVIDERETFIKNARKTEKKKIHSKIEKGDMNVFL